MAAPLHPMTPEGIAKFQTELDATLRRFDGYSEKHKNLARRLRYCVLLLTGISTFLSGLALSDPARLGWLNIFVVAAGVGVTVVTSIEGMRKASELWLHERNTANALRDLKRELDLRLANGETALDFNYYFGRLQSILSAAAEEWMRFSQNVNAANQPQAPVVPAPGPTVPPTGN